MDEKLISKYITNFYNLNRGTSRGMGKAPHKLILLLSIISLIKKQEILNNKIFITSALVLEFRNIWKKLVRTEHTENFALPYFHMRSEPFWYLVEKPDGRISITKSKSIKSFKNLKENVAFAEIDNDLFYLLTQPYSRSILETALLSKYFPQNYKDFLEYNVNLEESQIEYEIQNTDSKEYREKLMALKNTMKQEQFEEEIFVRGGLFKKTVPKIYNFTCAISGMNITSTHNVQMVDACHIYPFSLSHDDTITNGIALAPNLHRAFDRGLITVNSDYIVRVSPSVSENESSFSLSQFEGTQISLPKKLAWYPSIEYLNWHNKEVYLL
ncbi:putative restriction endonuclease [Gillisia sp. Hel1_33_143]|uniref:HNH endonuclease n=1 Tax=Gillisia sp. Hel1_33_143 TaxID=1336796 RepID=UPI00087D2E09|nr:HNH endonuclease [Gillisia sp. Hel1_33_143]SDS31358.1 putative restriction endonuclease [Gillisia sp. Hel1_33_143]